MKLAMYKWLGASAGLVALVAFSAAAFAEAPVVASPQMKTPVHFAQTAPLRDLPLQMPSVLQRIVGSHKISLWQKRALLKKLTKAGYLKHSERRSLPVHRKKYYWSKAHRVKDPVRQTSLPDLHHNSFTDLIANFDTISNQWSIFPPDPNAAVGENYVTMIVNLGFAVYDKSGNLIMGPVDTNTLWAPLGGECASDNNGDPIVLYDQIGHHWLITQFALSGPYDQCIAVSATSDPTGSWYLYDYQISQNSLNDYPKFGVWPDAFYATWNLFPSGFSGVAFGAFDRTAMEAGDPNAQMVLFTTNQNQTMAYSDLPASMDGSTPPPAGAPGIFINYVSPGTWGVSYYALELWQMHVDWVNPGNSTLTGPTQIDVDPFNDLCGGGLGDCIPQPSGPLLESLTDRLMYRLAYRNLGDHQTLILMHNVSSDNNSAPVGERWYELDAPAGSTDPNDWTVVQQSTFSPDDGLSRWMGSIAMDHVGNIAMGYSTADSSQYPSIVYTGRLASDPPGEMTEPETTIQAGKGSQTRSGGRWGDYSSMVTDPTDDCTFWYANEYMPTTSLQGWRGHIAAFKFPNCSEGPQGTLTGKVTNAVSGKPIINATVALTPGNLSVTTNDAGSYTIQVAPGNYQATASGFGYSSQTIAVTIETGETTNQDFALSPAPSAVLLGGRVNDQGHGYPLYAKVSVALNGSTVASTWTGLNGTYKLPLPSGNSYAITVTPFLTGYAPGTATVALTTNTRQNFTLSPDASCTAPGYSFPFGEGFDEGGFPPTGWTIAPATSTVTWQLSSQDTAGSGNYTGGTGNAAVADSNETNESGGPYDTSLVTAPIQVADVGTTPVVQFLENYVDIGDGDTAEVDISTDGGTTWTPVLTQTTSCGGGVYLLPGCSKSVALGSYLEGASSFQLRFRYYNLAGGWDWYWQIDDLSIGTCSPVPGGLVFGNVTDATTGNQLMGASLTDESGRTTETVTVGDQTGFVIFEPAGEHTLTASDTGYQSQSLHGSINDGQRRQVHYSLTASVPAAGPEKQ